MHTRSGWLDRLEVVEVRFDPTIVSYDEILNVAIKKDCATRVFAHTDEQLTKAKAAVGDRAVKLVERATDAKPADQLFALTRSPQRFLPLTPMQATKVNADLRRQRASDRWLSPRQKELLRRINAVLAHDEHALDELVRPKETEKLNEYQKQLIKALTALESAIARWEAEENDGK